jgi:hypothetical protein
MRKSLIVSTVFASALLLPACGDPKPPEAAANGTEEIVAPSENAGGENAGMAAEDNAMNATMDSNMAADTGNNAAGTEPAGAGSNGGPVIKKP